ncbi:MAG: beta-ketoacyl-[acyl-carrier-protein] synthase family protein [bacterium]
MRDRRKVVVTGLGVVSPVGLDESTLWQNMIGGRHGIRLLSLLNAEEFKSKSVAEIDQTLLAAALAARQMRPADRAGDLATLAAAQALEAAGLAGGQEPVAKRVAVVIGTGGGVSESVEDAYRRYWEGGLKGIRPTTIVRVINNSISGNISIKYRLTGPNFVITSACASASNAIGMAMRMVRDGYEDKVLCGGTDSLFSRSLFGAWDKIGAMSKNPDPNRASRPFDTDRDGFVMGEGAAMIVVESEESAKARGVRIRGEICGYGESSDADHFTRPSSAGQAAAIRAALDDAGVRPDEVGFVNAHGTATEANDECECQSIRDALGNAADDVLVASNKSFFGHAMGASGALESVVTLLGLENGIVPPNLNLDHPDPKCTLRFVPGTATAIVPPVAIKNSFAFGGTNAVLVFRRYVQDHGGK